MSLYILHCLTVCFFSATVLITTLIAGQKAGVSVAGLLVTWILGPAMYILVLHTIQRE